MDAVYALGTGTTWQNMELLFSLRSLQEFLPDIDRVVVVGERPPWLKDVIHIPARDPHKCKERNIMEKVLKACAVASPKFLFMNDDHFALRTQLAFALPAWCAGTLAGLGNRLKAASHYRQALLNTDKVLAARGHSVHNFDIHTPIVYDAVEFPKVMTSYDWELLRGYVVKSLYANSVGLPYAGMADLKLSHVHPMPELVRLLKGRAWFSTSPTALTHQLKALFAELYPVPSRWEAT
jgi:hypothetical protein